MTSATSAPLVTVYIANHNYGRFVQQAIESVLNQTLRDFELIIIDDGSTDNSREIIERYSERKNVIIVMQQNRGLSVTNNIALRMARGRYIVRLDADDYLDENALRVLTEVLERNPDVGMVFPDYFVVDEEGTILEIVRRHDFDKVTLMDQPAHGACTLVRRKCLLELGGYDESLDCQDGYELWIRFIQHFRVQNVNLPLFYYRRHSQSLSHDETRILTTRAEIFEKLSHSKGRYLSAIAIVPVRGRVTDPQSPALRPLGGRALIDWTLEVALQSKRLSDILVTTPDEELLAYVAKNYENRVLTVKRDRRLALPNTYIEDTLYHALKEYCREHPAPDVLVVLYIESPFRQARQIDSAIEAMEVFDTDTVISVRPEMDMFYQHNGAGLESLRKARLLRLEREELYREAGQIYVVKRTFFEAKQQIVGGKVGHIVLDQQASLRLRSDWDWQVAELYASRINKMNWPIGRI